MCTEGFEVLRPISYWTLDVESSGEYAPDGCTTRCPRARLLPDRVNQAWIVSIALSRSPR
jgi:hypothetical protein